MGSLGLSQDLSDSEYSAVTHFSMSLAYKYVNLKEPYNQDIKGHVTIKIFLKKKTGFTWNPQPKRHSIQDVFQIQSPICGVNVSNNMSITHVKVSERKTDLNFETSLPLSSSSYDLIICPHLKYPPINLLRKFVSHAKLLYGKSSPILCRGRGEPMLYLDIFFYF